MWARRSRNASQYYVSPDISRRGAATRAFGHWSSAIPFARASNSIELYFRHVTHPPIQDDRHSQVSHPIFAGVWRITCLTFSQSAAFLFIIVASLSRRMSPIEVASSV